MKKLPIALACALACACAVTAADRPFQASLTPDWAICEQSDAITGLAINLWGCNEAHAIALGLINGSFGQSGGFSLGAFNYADRYHGVQGGLLNAASDLDGCEVGFVNYVTDDCKGWQLGFGNYAGRLSGVQVGFVNMAAQTDTGLQVGFVNLIPQNRRWFGGLPNELAPVMVFLNWRL